MSEQQGPNIGVSLMHIHRAITRGLSVSLENGQAFAEAGFPDKATEAGFWMYVQTFEFVTHGHHLTEDDLFFPYLHSRLVGVDFDDLMADHETIAAILGDIAAAREAASLEDLCRALVRMEDAWHPHRSKEETVFSPQIAAEIMTPSEHIEMGQKAAAHSQEHGGPAPLVIPFVLYNLEPGDRASMAAAYPPEIPNHLVPVVWKEQWAPMKPLLLD
jgi:hemerythrin-like domain-containing protein